MASHVAQKYLGRGVVVSDTASRYVEPTPRVSNSTGARSAPTATDMASAVRRLVRMLRAWDPQHDSSDRALMESAANDVAFFEAREAAVGAGSLAADAVCAATRGARADVDALCEKMLDRVTC